MRPARLAVAAVGLMVCLGAMAPACLLNSLAFETDSSSTAGSAGSGAGTATDPTSGTTTSSDTAAGGATGTTTAQGGTAGSGATSGSGGAGGAGPPPDGDKCPGLTVAIPPYTPLPIRGDTTFAIDDDGATNCGGGNAPDVVYAITTLTAGRLTAALTTDPTFDGFLHVRSVCDEQGSQLQCSEQPITLPVAANGVVFLIVDGHLPSPSGSFNLLLHLESCGNGIIEGPEECDDGNNTSGDKCSATCIVECDCPGCGSSADTHKDPITHHCYRQVYNPNENWQTARNKCIEWGGDLAALSTTEEIVALTPFLNINAEDCWLGGTDATTAGTVEGTFIWVNKEPWSYLSGQLPWNGIEPNGNIGENCVEMRTDEKFNDIGCNDTNNYLCERYPAGKLPGVDP